MFTLVFEDLIYIHDKIIDASGGLKGIRDEGVIRSAIARPYQTAFGVEIHDDLFKKAAALLDAIANNHGFTDGNKRTAMAAANIFLFAHKIKLKFTNDEYTDFMIYVVTKKPSIAYIKNWLTRHADTKLE